MHRYALVTEWVLATTIERVWDVLVEPESWSRWWRYVDDVALLVPGDARGIGAVRRYTWSSPLRYRLTFDMTTTRIASPHALDGIASGELQGTGCWRLRGEGANAHVRYEWRVVARKRWMNVLAWLLAPLFVWSHDRVMAAGARGLARRLGVPLLAQRTMEGDRMHYVLIYELAPDYVERRGAFRNEHLKLAWEAEGMVLGGALADPVDRAMLLFEADSPDTAKRFANADPYVKNGLVKRWEVRPWTTVVGEMASQPVHPEK